GDRGGAGRAAWAGENPPGVEAGLPAMTACRTVQCEADVCLRVELGHASRQRVAKVVGQRLAQRLRRSRRIVVRGLDDTACQQRLLRGGLADARGEVGARRQSKADPPVAVLEDGRATLTPLRAPARA